MNIKSVVQLTCYDRTREMVFSASRRSTKRKMKSVCRQGGQGREEVVINLSYVILIRQR